MKTINLQVSVEYPIILKYLNHNNLFLNLTSIFHIYQIDSFFKVCYKISLVQYLKNYIIIILFLLLTNNFRYEIIFLNLIE